MSVGEASIGLNLGTAQLDSDVRNAERILNRIGRGVIENGKQAEKAIEQLSAAGVTSVDRLQRSFNTLNIKTGMDIDNEKRKITAAFEQIKNSGVASADEIKRAHAAMQSKLDSVGGSASKTSSIFSNLNSAVIGAFAGFSVQQVISQLHQAGMAAERLRNSFEAATGSMAKGASEFGFARSESNRLGLDLQSTADAYLKLTASARGTALEGQKTRDIFTSVAGAGRSLGLSGDQMSGALLAISQMMSKGTVQAEELRGQLGERLPGAFNIAARAMKVSTAELGKMLEQGKVVSEDFLPLFAAELQKTFPPGEKAMNGMTAETARLKTAWYELKTTVMEGGGESMFTNSIKGMKDMVKEADTFYGKMSGAWRLLKDFAKNPMNPNLGGTVNPAKLPPLTAFDNALTGIPATGTGIDDLVSRGRAGKLTPIMTVDAEARAAQEEEMKAEKRHKKKVVHYSRENDLLLKNIEEYTRRQEEIEKGLEDMRLEDIKEWASAVRKEDELIESTRIEQLKYEGEEAYRIMQETAEEQKKAYDASAIGGMTNAIKKYGEEATNIGKQVEQVFTNAFKNIENAIVTAFQTGKINAKAMLDSITADVIRMSIAKPITNYLAQQFAPATAANAATGTAAVSAGSLSSYAMPILGAVAAVGIFASVMDASAASSEAYRAEVKRATVELKAMADAAHGTILTDQGKSNQAALDAKQLEIDTRISAAKQYLDKVTEDWYRYHLLYGDKYNNTITRQATMQSAQVQYNDVVSAGAIEIQLLKDKQALTRNNLLLTEMELKQLKGTADYTGLLSKVREAEMYSMDDSDKAIQRRIYALQDEAEATKKTTDAIGKTVDIAISAASAMKAIQGGSLSTDSPEEKYRKAMAAFTGNADNSKAGELGQAFLTASQMYNASGAGYQADYKLVMGKLGSIAGMPAETTADKQLTVLEQIRDALKAGEYGQYVSGLTDIMQQVYVRSGWFSGHYENRVVGQAPVYSTGITSGEGNNVSNDVLIEQNRILTELLNATKIIGTKTIAATEATATASTTTAQKISLSADGA